MRKPITSGAPALASLLAVLALAGCEKKVYVMNAYTAPTAQTHRGFPIASGPHAVDCTTCHGAAAASFKDVDCLSCHTRAPTEAVHTTTGLFTYEYGDSTKGCRMCHVPNPTTFPFDHKGITVCAGCHAQGNFYAAFPTSHRAINGADCSTCHATSTWLNVSAPLGVVSDPASAVTVNALVARYAGTSIVQLSPQSEVLPMGMDHATTQVNMAGLACAVCHLDANQGSLYPGLLHSPLANLLQTPPSACGDCHGGSAPRGFVGPTATSPARTPPSGEMKHDAVLWAGGASTATRVVTADCGVCHLAPNQNLAATWSTWTSGTLGANALPQFHSSLTAVSLAQPASCVDCHANTRPQGVLSSSAAALAAGLTFDHANVIATGDCLACHAGSTSTWAGGRFHLPGTTTNPSTCLPCHAGQRPSATVNPVSGWNSLTYTLSPFDYLTNAAGITHGDGQDCAACHKGPGSRGSTPAAWGVSQTFEGGAFTHGPGTVATATCIACHMSQRPDLAVAGGAAAVAAMLSGFDHAVNTGDCIGCHQSTATAGRYVDYYGAGGAFPGGDWKGGKVYPGSLLVSAPNRFVTITEVSLVRPAAGAMVTGMTSIQDTLYNAMLHTSAAIPAQLAPGTSANGDQTTCWHCHVHTAAGAVSSYANGVFHAALTGYSATVGGAVTALPQPTGQCLDCHAQMRPPGIVEKAGSNLQPMDHAAAFTGTVSIGGQSATSVADLECATCHKTPGGVWTDGTFHARIGTAVPADCVACHYPLMADGARANVVSGTAFAMSHASTQLPFQACATCHTGALAGSGATPLAATAWKPGAYHASLPTQPTACLDCHAVSEPAPNSSTQSSWTYVFSAGGTGSNSAQWMNHGAAPVAGADCATCHAGDARSVVTTWSKSTEFHVAVTSPGTCQVCHGLTNGGGTVAGTNNNLPAGLTSSSVLTTASANTLTGVPAGTQDQITHLDVNVAGHDCAFCHTQAGRSTKAGVQGAEWAQASFHASFSAATPLLLNGTTGRCSNCHLNVKPGTTYTAMDHSGFTATSAQDCSACHSWPGTATPPTPNWKGATGTPLFITVGGFAIPLPPAATATTQVGIASLPHPALAAGASCATCHTGGAGGKNAIGYDHLSTLINAKCSACHEAGSNLVGTIWNKATTQSAGAGDTRPFTLTTIVATRGRGGGTCNITLPNHFYPVDCAQCHAIPAANGAVTTGTAYTAAWSFPHTESRMTNPSTCNLCHTGQNCGK